MILIAVDSISRIPAAAIVRPAVGSDMGCSKRAGTDSM